MALTDLDREEIRAIIRDELFQLGLIPALSQEIREAAEQQTPNYLKEKTE